MGGRGRRGWRRWQRLNLVDGIIETTVKVLTENPYQMPDMPTNDVPHKGYLVVASCWDGAKTPFYPLFPQDRAWRLVARDGRTLHELENAVHEQHRFGMDQPTLAWQNGTQRMELYVDGLDHTAFLERYGLGVRVTKNGFVTAKRLSRLLRDYRMFAHLPENEIAVDVMDLDETGKDIWDGSGLISRGMLERLSLSSHLMDAARERLQHELQHIGRVEFTLVNSAGQYKGHAIVVDDLPTDFQLPPDVKKDVYTTNGTAFIGINAVHHTDDMRLDIQSIMNLHPFFDHTQMLDYLQQQETLFYDAVDSGQKAAAMARLDQATSEELLNWPLRNFFARGGDAKWFPGMVKEFFNGAIDSAELSLERGKVRLPVPGGRYYVMTSDVAQAAGLNIPVERGQIHLDSKTATAWVHREDWLHLPDSPSDNPMGIKHILGGADQDDALWVHGFTDHDGQRRVLAWRSPNNTGEYVTLQPTATSQPLLWDDPSGATLLDPPGDSRKLIPRIDRLAAQQTSLGLAHDPLPGELGQGQPYTPELMEAVNARTLENAGILGGYCNFTLAYKGILGQPPGVLPDTLERVIDNDVKLGGSNALVGEKIREMSNDLIASGAAVPPFLLSRLGVYPDRETGAFPRFKKVADEAGAEPRYVPLRTTDGTHWVDQLAHGVQQYVERLTQRRNALMQQARLPAAVHDSVALDTEALRLGAKFNETYAKSLHEARQQYCAVLTAHPTTERAVYERQRSQYDTLVFDYVRQQTEAVLDGQPDERHTAILRGAMVSRELGIRRSGRSKPSLYDELGITSDAALWQRGRIAETSIRALQEVGLLGEMVEETNAHGRRLVRYPTPSEVKQQATYQPVKINQVWFNRHKQHAAAQGQTLPDHQRQVDPAVQKQRKQEVRFLAGRTQEQGGFLGQRLRVGERDFGGATTTLVWEDEQGQVFGVIDKKMRQDWYSGDEAVIRQAKSDHDGNLIAVMEHVTNGSA